MKNMICISYKRQSLFFFPTCQVRISRFYQSYFLLLLLLPSFLPPPPNSELQISVGTAGPHQRTPDHSGHCRTATTSSGSQWALPHRNIRQNARIDARKNVRIDAKQNARIESQNRMSDRMPEQNRMSENTIYTSRLDVRNYDKIIHYGGDHSK